MRRYTPLKCTLTQADRFNVFLQIGSSIFSIPSMSRVMKYVPFLSKMKSE